MAVIPVRERTRREVLDQSLRLFTSRGYTATTLQDIAAAAGCSKATVLYHFADKAAVLGEVLRPTTEQLQSLIDRVHVLPRDEAQTQVIEGFVELVVRHRGLVAVMREVKPSAQGPAELLALVETGRRLPGLLAASNDPLEQHLALFAIHGVLGDCRELDDQPDDVLRLILLTALRRILRPA